MKLFQWSLPVWSIFVLCVFVEIVLVMLIWKGPLVDTSEHRRAVQEVFVGMSTNRSDVMRAYQSSLRRRSEVVWQTRIGLSLVAALNGAVILFLLLRLGTIKSEGCAE